MNSLAHTTYGAQGFKAEKRALAELAQEEIQNAKCIQKQTGCTWTEALRLAAKSTKGCGCKG